MSGMTVNVDVTENVSGGGQVVIDADDRWLHAAGDGQ